MILRKTKALRIAKADLEARLDEAHSLIEEQAKKSAVDADYWDKTLQGAKASFAAEKASLLQAHAEEIKTLTHDTVKKAGAIDALTAYMRGSEDRLRVIESGHRWHIGGKVEAHDGSSHILYECACGVKISGPEGFLEVGQH